MNDSELRDAVVTSLLDVVPEATTADIDPAAPIQEQLDIDSMDFLDYLEGVAKRTGVEVPEAEYDRVATVDGCVAYLAQHR